MDEKQPHSREEVLRQIEVDLQDEQLVNMVGIVLTWAKARGISLDRLEDAVFGAYRP